MAARQNYLRKDIVAACADYLLGIKGKEWKVKHYPMSRSIAQYYLAKCGCFKSKNGKHIHRTMIENRRKIK